MTQIHTIDLIFQGITRTIASYLIPHKDGVVLVESGPGSTIPSLERDLTKAGYTFSDVTDVLLTHIHLDHAGASGWLAQQGARIHVHEVGAPHMINPTRLLSSATRIYGDMMGPLWGEFLPVPEENLSIVADGEDIEISELVFKALDTPGHASHHMCYLFEDVLFTGDVGGIRLPGPTFVRLPTPPPEFNIENWRDTIAKLKKIKFDRVAPTHYGIHNADGHLAALESAIDDVEAWMDATLPLTSEKEALREPFIDWEYQRCENAGINGEALHAYNLAMPLGMGADGIWRYWQKYHAED